MITKSHLIENLVFLKCLDEFKEVFFSSANKEIDFVTDNYMVDVKYQRKIIANDYQQMKKYSYNKILVTKDLFARRDDVLMIPVEYFLLS